MLTWGRVAASGRPVLCAPASTGVGMEQSPVPRACTAGASCDVRVTVRPQGQVARYQCGRRAKRGPHLHAALCCNEVRLLHR